MRNLPFSRVRFSNQSTFSSCTPHSWSSSCCTSFSNFTSCDTTASCSLSASSSFAVFPRLDSPNSCPSSDLPYPNINRLILHITYCFGIVQIQVECLMTSQACDHWNSRTPALLSGKCLVAMGVLRHSR